MARTIFDLETNKNAVIMNYSALAHGPRFPGDKPVRCVVIYHGYPISASIYEKGFRVFSNAENFSKHFDSLREAKQFILKKVNKKRTLFD